MIERVKIDGVELTLSHPDTTEANWVGQEEYMKQLMACWLVVAKEDFPLCPRLIGKPGVGKTTLALAGAKILHKPVYIYQCTMDTRPEDLIVTPVLGENGKIRYHASPVVTAMLKGGVCILDEGNRMSEKSWASLAPLLDHRRYVESILAGIKIKAHPDFRCCVTMNDDASTYELPDYIMSRLQPMIEISFPNKQEELKILKYNIPFAKKYLLDQTVNLLQSAHRKDMDCTSRDGIHILRYSIKRLTADSSLNKQKVWEEAVKLIIGATPDEIKAPPKPVEKKEKNFHDLANFFLDADFFTQSENYNDERYTDDPEDEDYEDDLEI